MKMPHLKMLLRLHVMLGVLATAGCTHMMNVPPTPYTGYAPGKAIHLKVAVNITDELRSAKTENHFQGDTWVISLGPPLAENAPLLARHTFTDVVEINNGGPPPEPIDAILTPKVVFVGQIMSDSPVISLKMEWTLSDATGSVVWVDTITGEGRGSPHLDRNLKLAWEAVLKKSQQAIWYSRTIREFAMMKYAEVKLVDAPTSNLPPDVMKLCDELNSLNVEEVMRALKGLRKMDAPGAVPEILPCLQRSEHHILRDACRTLAVLGNKDTIPAIEPLLKNSRSDVRKDARVAIATLRAKP